MEERRQLSCSTELRSKQAGEQTTVQLLSYIGLYARLRNPLMQLVGCALTQRLLHSAQYRTHHERSRHDTTVHGEKAVQPWLGCVHGRTCRFNNKVTGSSPNDPTHSLLPCLCMVRGLEKNVRDGGLVGQ
jgi:hypothetical protein